MFGLKSSNRQRLAWDRVVFGRRHVLVGEEAGFIASAKLMEW